MKSTYTGKQAIISVGGVPLGYTKDDIVIEITDEGDVSALPRLSAQDLHLLELDDQALDIFETLFNKLIATGVVAVTDSTKKLLDERAALDLLLNPPPIKTIETGVPTSVATLTATSEPVIIASTTTEPGPTQS